MVAPTLGPKEIQSGEFVNFATVQIDQTESVPARGLGEPLGVLDDGDSHRVRTDRNHTHNLRMAITRSGEPARSGP